MLLIDYLSENFLEDKDNWVLWLPIFFVIGIIIRFYNYTYTVFYLLFFILILQLFFLKRFRFFLPFIFLVTGIIRSNIYIKNFKNFFLTDEIGYVDIDGYVEKINLKKNFSNKDYKEILVSVKKITPTENSFNNFKKNHDNFKFPKKVIIRLQDKDVDVYRGYIKINTILYPVSEKIFYTSFDFKTYYFFQNVGAIGYKGKVIKNIRSKETINDKISNFRNKLITKEKSSIKIESIDIIMALLTGNQKIIDKDIVEIVNYAGISHILSISGLHMITLMGLVLFIVKWILLRSEHIALNYNVFKIASIVSLIINFFYLALTGFSISAVRAYIMNVILLLSIVLERFNYSLRNAMFVGFIMLFIRPDITFNPAFQMSFISVISLTGGYEFFQKMKNDETTLFYTISKHRIIFYFVLSFITSMLAELSTTPFSIYHFNNYTFYNVFSNLITVPLTTFFILPVSILAIPLYFFNLEKFILIPVCYAMNFILYISRYINNIPNSIIFIQSPNNISISFMILGILWFCLWSEKWRKIGIIFYLIGISIIPFQKKPDLIIDYKSNNLIVKNNKNDYFSIKKMNHSSKTILNKLGKNEINNINNFYNINCHKNCPSVEIKGHIIEYRKNNTTVIINNYDSIEYKIDNYKKIIKLKNTHTIFI